MFLPEDDQGAALMILTTLCPTVNRGFSGVAIAPVADLTSKPYKIY